MHDPVEFQFVVDEVADAHRVGDGFLHQRIGCGAIHKDVAHLILESGIEDVVEFDSAVLDDGLAVLDFHFLEFRKFAVEVAEGEHIGFFAHEHEFVRAPVSDRVDAPCGHALPKHFEEIRLIVLLAVFFLEVPVREGHQAVLGHRLCEPLRMFVAPGRIGMSAEHVDARGPEETSFRVDKEPFVLVFRNAEITGRLELGTVLPAAETVPLRGRGGLLQLGKLFFMILFEIGVGMDFLGPFAVFVLTVVVDERHVFVARNLFGEFRRPFQTEIGKAAVDEVFSARFVRPDHLELNGIDFRRVQRILEIVGVLRVDLENRLVREIEAHRAFFPGIQSDSSVGFAEILLLAAAGRDMHGQAQLVFIGEVLHIDGEDLSLGKIEELFPLGGIDPDSGIPFRSVGPEHETVAFPLDFRLVAGFVLVFRIIQRHACFGCCGLFLRGKRHARKNGQNGHCRQDGCELQKLHVYSFYFMIW